jgi:hypothetical protein
MDAVVTVDTQIFRDYVTRLARAVGGDIRDVVRNEFGVVVKACFVRTRLRPLAKAKAGARMAASRFTNREVFNTSSNSVLDGMGYVSSGFRDVKKSGDVWFRARRTGKRSDFVYMGKTGAFTKVGPSVAPMMKNAAAQYKVRLKKEIEAAVGSVALARNSWVQMADASGIRLEAVQGGGRVSAAQIQQARKAVASNGRRYTNGTATEHRVNDRFFIKMTNSLPYGKDIGLDVILAQVISGRVKQFEKLVKKGYLNNAEALAKSYPNQIIVRK